MVHGYIRGQLDSMRIQAATLALATIFLTLVAGAEEQSLQLLDFEIKDQFGDTHRRTDVRGDVVMLIGSDREGSAFNAAWAKAISEKLGDHPGYGGVSHLAHADMRGVPFFLKGFVRGKFPKNRDRWVLLDWKGIIAKTYSFTPKHSNILVFAPTGALVHQAAVSEADDEALSGIVNALKALLDQGQ